MITDTALNNIAKALSSESFSIPSHVAFSDSVITPDPTDTSLPTEYDRSSVSITRNNNEVSYTAIRNGTLVSGSGDYINSVGLFSAASGGELFAEALVPSILQTSAFDLEVEWKITIERK